MMKTHPLKVNVTTSSSSLVVERFIGGCVCSPKSQLGHIKDDLLKKMVLTAVFMYGELCG